MTIYHGDSVQLAATVGPVDHIVTDPPYPVEFIPTYPEVWISCDVSLRNPGNVFAMVGCYKLPDVLNGFPRTWKYLWCMCFEQRQKAASNELDARKRF